MIAPRLVLSLVVAALLLPVPAQAGGRVVSDAERASELVGAINAARAKHGLRPLAASQGLARAASAHAVAMGTRGFFGHQGFERRVSRWYRGARTTGENVAWWSPELSPERTVALWLASPGHRANLLSRAFREVGVSAVQARSAPGVFRGLDVTIVVASFGARA